MVSCGAFPGGVVFHHHPGHPPKPLRPGPIICANDNPATSVRKARLNNGNRKLDLNLFIMKKY